MYVLLLELIEPFLDTSMMQFFMLQFLLAHILVRLVDNAAEIASVTETIEWNDIYYSFSMERVQVIPKTDDSLGLGDTCQPHKRAFILRKRKGWNRLSPSPLHVISSFSVTRRTIVLLLPYCSYNWQWKLSSVYIYSYIMFQYCGFWRLVFLL